LVGCLSLLASGGSSLAQLVFATDQFDAPQYLIDVEFNRSFQVASPWLYGGPGAWAMTADNALGVVYYSNAQELYRVSAATLRPEYLGTMRVDGEPTFMVGLAWHDLDQKMYGISSYPESGIYEIDLITLEATLVMPVDPANNASGLEYDNGTESLLALYDGFGSNGGALYSIDIENRQVTFITGYPPNNITDIDGLAAGDGRAYLVTDRNRPIFVYDLVANEYLPDLTSPVRWTGVMCGAAWAPSFMDRLLTSEPVPGQVGRNNRFHVVGAQPGSTVHLVIGFNVGTTRVPGCSGTTLEIASPRIMGNDVADAEGRCQIGAFVPAQAFGIPIVYQVVDPGGCNVSNLTFFSFGPE
jgi:hypothetical protein